MGYALREAIANFRRLWRVDLIAIGVIIVSCFLLGTFYLLTITMYRVIREAESRMMEIEVYVKDNVDQSDVMALIETLRTLPMVRSVEQIDKDRAAEEFRKEFGSDLLDALSTNPLPSSLRIHLKEGKHTLDRMEEMMTFLQGRPGIDEVVYQREWARKLSHLVSMAVIIDLSLCLIVVLASVFVVYSVVRLSILHRHPAIEVMRLIGATEGFIRRPFVIDGTLYGLIGGGLAGLLIYAGVRHFQATFPEWRIESIDRALFLSPAVGVALTTISSWFSARKVLSDVE